MKKSTVDWFVNESIRLCTFRLGKFDRSTRFFFIEEKKRRKCFRNNFEEVENKSLVALQRWAVVRTVELNLPLIVSYCR